MNDVEKRSSIETFENIPIDSLDVRGLRLKVRNALKDKGIKRIGDLKGKTSKELPNVMHIDVLGEILYIIGIEEKLDWEYFREYPLISKENDTIAQICENPLQVPLARLDLLNIAVTALGKRKPPISKIKDLIGVERDEILRTHGIGNGTGRQLCIALQRHNITVTGGKFNFDLGTEKSVDTEESGDKALRELRRFLILTAQVSRLSGEDIGRANAALEKIINDARGRGDGTDG